MPCNCDYMQASGQELESKRVCELIVYLFSRIGKDIPQWVLTASEEYYGNRSRIDEATKLLCEACRSLTEKEVEAYIYDAHNAGARRLAGWWERHQEWDARRVREEDVAHKQAVLKNRALKKLTPDEMKALGLL